MVTLLVYLIHELNTPKVVHLHGVEEVFRYFDQQAMWENTLLTIGRIEMAVVLMILLVLLAKVIFSKGEKKEEP